MKKLLQPILLFTALLVFSVTYAQEQRQAILTEDGTIQLSEEHEPDGRFEIDLGDLEFESSHEMTAYFQERCQENFVLRALPNENKVIMIIRGDKNPDWTVAQWNAHLAQKLSENPITSQE